MLFRGLLFLNIKVTKNKIIKKRDYYFDYYKRIFFDFLNQKVGCCVFTQKMSSNIHLIKKNQKVGCCVFTQK